ncbi:MAG: DUF1289 domain-containing protein [Betaproteobacteria bacterium]|nr:DUF1289 domain-containing protein [Betaproteobacteria bacterium]
MTNNDFPTFPASIPSEGVPSPCIKVCVIDPDTGWCLGCRRSLDEIAGWPEFSDDEKRAVLASLPARAGTVE